MPPPRVFNGDWLTARITRCTAHFCLVGTTILFTCGLSAVQTGKSLLLLAELGGEPGGLSCRDGFNDHILPNPEATMFYDAMPGPRRYQSTTTARCAKELTDLPVVTSNDAYRLGNAVERQGVDWLGARRHVLQHPKTFEDSILYNFLMGEVEEQRAFLGCVVDYKRKLKDGKRIPSLHHGDNRTIVVPLRLSDKVRFMVEDYPVVNSAIVRYKRMHCPWCDKLVLMTLLVWGEDKNHMFAYSQREYKQSLAVLHTIAKTAQSKEGGNLAVVIRSTLNADDDFVYCAYSPHLVLPVVTPSSWNRLLMFCNRALLDRQRELSAVVFFDSTIQPKLKAVGRRQETLAYYMKLESQVPDDVVANWFQSEVKRKGLAEHSVTVKQMSNWRDWPSRMRPYRVGLRVYDVGVRSIHRAAQQK